VKSLTVIPVLFFFLQDKVNFSLIAPRHLPVYQQVFELALPVGTELDQETSKLVDHSILPGHLVLFHGFEVAGTPCGCGCG
jgi:hypothetical protein